MSRKRSEPYKQHNPRVRYTEQELRDAYVADLEADLAHSLEKDPKTPQWESYRDDLRVKIAHIRSGGFEPLCVPQ